VIGMPGQELVVLLSRGVRLRDPVESRRWWRASSMI
jgi:hypothetical protein